jgi:hypothetical protein
LKFGTCNYKSLPIEIYNNEELSQFTVRFTAENNRLKRLPKAISALENLEYIDIQNNALTAFPGSVGCWWHLRQSVVRKVYLRCQFINALFERFDKITRNINIRDG